MTSTTPRRAAGPRGRRSPGLAIFLVLIMVVSAMPIQPAGAQGVGDSSLGQIVDEAIGTVFDAELPVVERNITNISDEVLRTERELESAVENAINQTLANVTNITRELGNASQPIQRPVREARDSAMDRVNATTRVVLENASAARGLVNETALLGVFVDPVQRDATPPVVGLNTARYYTAPPAEATSITSPAITLNRTTFDAYPDAWVHWALGEDRAAMERLGLSFIPRGDPQRSASLAGYPGDAWRVRQDPGARDGVEAWNANDPSRHAPARGVRTELVTPVVDLTSLPRVDTDQLDDVAEEALNLDPDDLADRARDQGTVLVEIGDEVFTALAGDLSVDSGCAIDRRGDGVNFFQSGPCEGEGTRVATDDDREGTELALENTVNTTTTGIISIRSVSRVLDNAVGPLRGPIRTVERTFVETVPEAYGVLRQGTDSVRGLFDQAANPQETEPEESDAAVAQLVLRHRYELQPREDGANVQVSIFDPTRNVWSPWRLLPPTGGPQYTITDGDEPRARAATPEDPAIAALQDQRPAWAGAPLNPRGLGWTNSSNGYVENTFDLSPYAGFLVRLRFFQAASSAQTPVLPDEGWYIDRVRVQALAHALEVGIPQQLVPKPGAIVAPHEPVPIVTKVRNQGRAPVEAHIACRITQAVDGLVVDGPEPCGFANVTLDPAQEQLVRFPSVRIPTGRDAQVELRVLPPTAGANDRLNTSLVTFPDADPSNNVQTFVFRAEPFVDHAIARVTAIPLEEIEAGIQAEGSPWRILVTVENRGNVPLSVGADHLNLTIEDTATGLEVTRLTTTGDPVLLERSQALVGPGLGSGRSRATFTYDWAAPLPGLYRAIAEVDAVPDRRPGNDEGVAFLSVRRANTGVLDDDVDQGYTFTDLTVEQDDRISYPSAPIEVRSNTSTDTMEDRGLNASGLLWAPGGKAGDKRWFQYQGVDHEDDHEEPIVLGDDRTVTFQLWGELARGARLEALWCPADDGMSVIHKCTDPTGSGTHPPNPVDQPSKYVPLVFADPDRRDEDAVITAHDQTWTTEAFYVPEFVPTGLEEPTRQGYLAFVHTSGENGRPIALDDVRVPVDRPTGSGGAADPRPGEGADNVLDTVDYALEPKVGNTRYVRYVVHEQNRTGVDVPRLMVRTDVSDKDNSMGEPLEEAWRVRGHVDVHPRPYAQRFVIAGDPGAVRSQAVPMPAENDWHLGDGSRSLWWGLAPDNVRSSARASAAFGPVDLRDVSDGTFEIAYRGWLPAGTARIEASPDPAQGEGSFTSVAQLDVPAFAPGLTGVAGASSGTHVYLFGGAGPDPDLADPGDRDTVDAGAGAGAGGSSTGTNADDGTEAGDHVGEARATRGILVHELATGSLRELSAKLPTATVGASAAWVPSMAASGPCSQGCAYVFGGATTDGTPLNSILRFDPAAPTDERVETLDTRLPEGLAWTSAIWNATGDHIVLLGGASQNGPRAHVLHFDPATGTLQAGAHPLALPLAEAAAAVEGDRVVLFGGRTTAGGGPTDAIVEFDLPTGTSTVLPARLPSPRAGATALFDGPARALVLGGTTSASSASGAAGTGVLAEVVEIDPGDPDPATVTIHEGVLPAGRSHAAHAATTGSALLFGGTTGTGPVRQVLSYGIDTGELLVLDAELPGPEFRVLTGSLSSLTGHRQYLRVVVETDDVRTGASGSGAPSSAFRDVLGSGILPVEVDRITFFERTQGGRATLVADLGFDNRPGLLEGGVSFRQGDVHIGDDAWYTLYGTRVAPTDGVRFFSAVPTFPQQTSSAATISSTDLARPFIQQVLCLDEVIDLSWASKPRIGFDHQLYINSPFVRDRQGVQSHDQWYDSAVVQVRPVGPGNAVGRAQGPPCSDPVGTTDENALDVARQEADEGWTTVRAFKGTHLAETWADEDIDLQGFAGENVQVRFVLNVAAYRTRPLEGTNLVVLGQAFSHKTHWLVDGVAVVGPTGKPIAPFDKGEDALEWDLDGAGPHTGVDPLGTVSHAWTEETSTDPNEAAYGPKPIMKLRAEPETLWHERVLQDGRRVHAFGRDHLTGGGIGPGYGLWAEEVTSPEAGEELGGPSSWDPTNPHEHVIRGSNYAPPQRLVTPELDVANLTEPILILRHAYNGSYLSNSTGSSVPCTPASEAGPDADEELVCNARWKSIKFLVEGRYQRFDGAWSPWLLVLENEGRPDVRVLHFEGDSGRPFPAFATDRIALKTLLPEDGTGRIQLAFRPANPLVTESDYTGFVSGGWLIDSIKLADRTVANDVGLIRTRLVPVVGRILDMDITGDGNEEFVLPPASSVSLNLTLANRGLFSQDPIRINVSWGDKHFEQLTALASEGQRGRSSRSLDVVGLPTPPVVKDIGRVQEVSKGTFVTPSVPNYVNLTLELEEPDEVPGDNFERIRALVAGVWSARLVNARVLPAIDEADAPRVVAVDLSNNGNVILGPAGPLPGDTRLVADIECTSESQVTTISRFEVDELPPVPPRGLNEPPRALPAIPLPDHVTLPETGTCEMALTFFVEHLELARTRTTFRILPEVSGDVVGPDSLDTWTRTGEHGELWNVSSSNAFSAPHAFVYTQPDGIAPGQAVLETPVLPAQTVQGSTSLVFAYNASLGVGDVATVEHQAPDGTWKRLSWLDPDANGTGLPVREISGITGLKVVTVDGFGVTPVLTDIFPPSNIPSAGTLEPVPVLSYTPSIDVLEPGELEALSQGWATADGSVLEPVAGQRMWYLDRYALDPPKEDQPSRAQLSLELAPHAGPLCLAWTWRGELLPSKSANVDNATVAHARTVDGTEHRTHITSHEASFDWTTATATVPADAERVIWSFERKAPGTGPARGLWIDAVSLTDGTCGAGGNVVGPQDRTELVGRRDFVADPGFRLVARTASDELGRFVPDPERDGRSIGVWDDAGLAGATDTAIVFPVMDLTTAQEEATLSFKVLSDLETGKEGYWLLYSTRPRGGAWTSWTFLEHNITLDAPGPRVITSPGATLLDCSRDWDPEAQNGDGAFRSGRDKDICTGAFATIPTYSDRSENPPPLRGERYHVFSGTRPLPATISLDLGNLIGREVRMAMVVATHGDGGSAGVRIDDLTLFADVLRGASTKLRFNLETQGESPGSTLMVDHVRLLGRTHEENVGVELAGIDGVELSKWGRDAGRLVLQPGHVHHADVRVSNTGATPACELSGVVALERDDESGLRFKPVGWSRPGCLGPTATDTISVPLIREGGAPGAVPNPDVDGDRVRAADDPDADDHLPYKLTVTVTAAGADTNPLDDVVVLPFIAKPVRRVHGVVEAQHVSPRVVENGTTHIRATAHSAAAIPLEVTVRALLVDASPDSGTGWGRDGAVNWTEPRTYTGERFGLDAQTVTLAPGDRPDLTWTATNLSKLGHGLYEVVIEADVDEQGLFEPVTTRSPGVPLWIDRRPIYLSSSFESKRLDGRMEPDEWGPLQDVTLTHVDDPSRTVEASYALEIEEATLYGVVIVSNPDVQQPGNVFIAFDGDERGTLAPPDDAVRLVGAFDDFASPSDRRWMTTNSACWNTGEPTSRWCFDNFWSYSGWTRYDEDNGTQVFEFRRALNTTDRQGDPDEDITLEPLTDYGVSLAFMDADESTGGSSTIGGERAIYARYVWPVDPYLPEIDEDDGTGDASGWATVTLPEADGVPLIGDAGSEDANPLRRARNPDYWREDNGGYRWDDAFLTTGAPGNPNDRDGGGFFTTRPSAGDEDGDDGAWTYVGPTQETGLHAADALVTPTFFLSQSHFEGATLRFTHKYAFEGADTGANIQLQLARWVVTEPNSTVPTAPGGYWTYDDAAWITLGPLFRHPATRGAAGFAPDAYDAFINDPPRATGDACENTPPAYTPRCGPGHPLHGERVWGTTFASDGFVTERVPLNGSLLCQAWERVDRAALHGKVRACEGTSRFPDDEPVYGYCLDHEFVDQPVHPLDLFCGPDLFREGSPNLPFSVAALESPKRATGQEPGEAFHRPLVPARLRFAVGADAADGAARASWVLDDLSVSAYDPQVRLIKTLADPFNLTLAEGQEQVLQLVVKNAARVHDRVVLESGFKGVAAPGWTLGVRMPDGSVAPRVERELAPGETWRVAVVVRPSVGVLAPDQAFHFEPRFVARSLSDPLATNEVVLSVDHATSQHSEIIATQLVARTQGGVGASAGELGTGAFVGVPVTVQGTLVNLGVQDAENVAVALEVTDPTGNVTRVPAPSGARAANVPVLSGGGGLARVAFEWRAQVTGPHTLALVADPDDVFKEADEANNRRTAPIDVRPLPLPDLQVVDLSLVSPAGDALDDTALVQDQLLQVVATIVNRGLSTAHDVRVEFRAGQEVFWTERGGALSAVEPGERVRVVGPWKAFTPGSSDVALTALVLFQPGEGGLFDANLDDNQRTRAVLVEAPDVSGSLERTAVEAAPQTVLTVPVHIANDGNAVDTVQVSLALPDPLRGTIFPSRSIPLAPGHGVDGALVLVVPPLTPAGTYTVKLTTASSAGQTGSTQALDVTVTAARAFATQLATSSIAPGDDEVHLRLVNTGNEALTGPLALGLPAPWTLVGEPPVVDLAPGDATVVRARIQSHEPPTAGPAQLDVGIEGVPVASKPVGLDVRAEGRIQLELAEPVELRAGERTPMQLAVRNVGNEPAEVRLEAAAGPEAGTVEGLPATLTVAAGQGASLTIAYTPARATDDAPSPTELPVRVVTAWQDHLVRLTASADLPDLAVTAIELARDPLAGQRVVTIVRVQNQGTAPAPASQVSLYVGDELAALAQLPPIPAGEERVARVNLTPTAGQLGLTAIVDEQGHVHEAVRANNALHETVDVENPGVITSLRRAVPAPATFLQLVALLGVALVAGRRRWGRT